MELNSSIPMAAASRIHHGPLDTRDLKSLRMDELPETGAFIFTLSFVIAKHITKRIAQIIPTTIMEYCHESATVTPLSIP